MRHKFPGTKTNLATDCAWEPAIYQIHRTANEKWGAPSPGPAFLQLSMMINKVPFVREAAGSIAQDYMERALEMSERCNRGSPFYSLCVCASSFVESLLKRGESGHHYGLCLDDIVYDICVCVAWGLR